jgi:hypothetical protein
MPTKVTTPTSTIKYVGFVDERKLLTTIRAWLISDGFEFKEPTYKNKTSAEGLDIEIKIQGEKKVTSYVKYWIDIQMWIREIKEVPVVKDGVQQLAKEGKVWIETSGYLELDWQNRFGGSKFLQALQDIYHKAILKKTIEVKWWDNLYYKIYKLNSVIRNTLGFETA